MVQVDLASFRCNCGWTPSADEATPHGILSHVLSHQPTQLTETLTLSEDLFVVPRYMGRRSAKSSVVVEESEADRSVRMARMIAKHREWAERQDRLKPLRPVQRLLRELNRAIGRKDTDAAQKQD